MKAGVTAMLFAYAYLARLKNRLAGKVSISIVSDEETGYGRGTGFMLEQREADMTADCILSGEPSGSYSISYASKGYVQFSVHISTRGAIAGYQNETENVISFSVSPTAERAVCVHPVSWGLPFISNTFIPRTSFPCLFFNPAARKTAAIIGIFVCGVHVVSVTFPFTPG